MKKVTKLIISRLTWIVVYSSTNNPTMSAVLSTMPHDGAQITKYMYILFDLSHCFISFLSKMAPIMPRQLFIQNGGQITELLIFEFSTMFHQLSVKDGDHHASSADHVHDNALITELQIFRYHNVSSAECQRWRPS